MNKYHEIYFIFTCVIPIIFSCSGNSEKEKEEYSPSETGESGVISIESFYGKWYLAVKRNDGWYEIDGCDEYGLNIQPSGGDYDSELSLSDRLGLSIDIWADVEGHTINEDGSFELLLHEIPSDDYFSFQGKIFHDHPEWKCTVIDVEPNKFYQALTWEVEGEFSALRLFKDNLNDAFIAAVDQINCETGFDNEFIPEGGLTSNNMTEEIAATLISSFDGELNEGFDVGFVEFGDYFMLILDVQNGDYTTLTFYSIDKKGNLLQTAEKTGVFEWLEGTEKYIAGQSGAIFMQCGNWEVVDGKQVLKTTDSHVEINSAGEIIFF